MRVQSAAESRSMNPHVEGKAVLGRRSRETTQSGVEDPGQEADSFDCIVKPESWLGHVILVGAQGWSCRIKRGITSVGRANGGLGVWRFTASSQLLFFGGEGQKGRRAQTILQLIGHDKKARERR